MKRSCLVPIAPGFEELEAIAPIDLLRRAGVEVVIASVFGKRTVSGKNRVQLIADVALDEVSEQEFDLLLLPGGPHVHQLRQSETLLKRVQHQHEAEGWLAAICAAPLLLSDAGLLGGYRYTAHQSTQNELPELLPEAVVVDRKIITSRGAGTAVSFALQVIELIFDVATRKEIAEAIHYQSDVFRGPELFR